MKKLCFLLFLISGFAFTQNLEEDIYSATETFIANQNASNYLALKKKEDIFKNQIKTKDEQLAFVFLLCNKGYYLRYKIPTEAISSYEDAWSRFSKHNLSKLSDYDIIENCLKPLGNLYTKGGDFTNAENIIKQYIFLAEQSNNTTQQIAGAINLSALYQTIGKHKTVVSVIDEALKIPNIQQKQKQKLENIKNTSLIASGKLEPNNVVIIDKPILSGSYNDNELNYQLALKNKDYKKALSHFNYKYIYLKKDTLSTRTKAKLDIEEAQLHYLLNDNKKASNKLKNAFHILLPNFKSKELPNKEDLYADNTFIDIFDLLAKLQHNTKQALECYNLSAHVSTLLYDNLTSQESKISNSANNRIRNEKCIELLYDDYLKDRNDSHFKDALQYAENTKALILKDVFKKKSLLEQFPNDSLLIKEQKLLKEQEQITNLLINEQLGSSKASNINTLSKQLNTISIELKTIKKDIELKYPQTDNTSFSIEELQQKLKTDDASLVEYFYGNQAIYQFIISSNSIGFNKIELSKDTKNEIITFNNLFEESSTINNDILDFTTRSFSMFNLLYFNEVSSTKNVIIIPDGLLNFVPFEALLTSKTESTNYSKMLFVIGKQTILYNTNILFYLNNKKVDNKPYVLGVFPVFDGTNQKLVHSVKEAENIENEITSTILMNEKASKNNFIKNANTYNTLHLSTHANAGNFTSPASISFHDENMTLNELYSLNLNADLVVLSACETGVGKVYKSEGAMSIARGFQFSGAKNVLFSLWQINDLSTSQIMESFYKDYSKHQSAYLANHHSKINYLQNENISNIKKSPYYWSAFVFYGELNEPQETYSSIYILFGLLLIGIIVFLFLKYRKQDGRKSSTLSFK